MIGNDVVDLNLAEKQSNWRRKGFLEKVFNPLERKIIAEFHDMHLAVWLLWSMKEAAYKAHQRKRSLPRRLNWKIQECIYVEFKKGKALGIVQIEDERYFSFSSLTSECIHTIAVDRKNQDFEKVLFQLPLYKTKLLITLGMAMAIGVTLPELHLKKIREGIPFIFYKNEAFPLALSFSDHGKFSGFCVSLMNS